MAVVDQNKPEVLLRIGQEGIETFDEVARKNKEQIRLQKEAAAAERELTQAAAEHSAKISKVGNVMKNFGGVVHNTTMNLEGLGNAVFGVTNMFGPWGAVIGGVAAAIGALFMRLKDTTAAVEENTDYVNKLAAAYSALGEEATIAAAKQKLVADEAAKAESEEMARMQVRLETLRGQKTQLDAESKRMWADAENLQRTVGEIYAQDSIAKAQKLEQDAAGIDREIQALEHMIQTEEAIRGESLRRKQQEEDEKREHELRLESYLAEKKQREQDAKEVAALEESERKLRDEYNKEQLRKKEEATKKHQELVSALTALEEQTIKAATTNATDLINLEYDKRLADARKYYASDKDLQARALAELEKQRNIALVKEDQAREARRAQLDKEARSAASGVGGGGDSAVAQAEAKAAQVRDKLMGEIERINQLLAKYQAEYTDTELANHTEYMALKAAEVQAAQNLADAQLQALADVSAARSADAEKAQQEVFDQVYANNALTKSQKQMVSAAKTGFDAMAEGAQAWGKGAAVIQKAQMFASGLQAGADAIDYAAQAAAFYAVGNIPAAVGMTAAAAGKTASAAAYAAGLADLGGGSLPTAGSSAASAVASGSPAATMTGAPTQTSNDITINFAFEGSDKQIAGALIRGLNMTTKSLGAQKLRKGLVSDRV